MRRLELHKTMCVLLVLYVAGWSSALAQGFKRIASFGGSNGANPMGTLLQYSDSELYGTTFDGGANNNRGTVFKVTTTGALKVIYSFCAQSNCADSENPAAGLVVGPDQYFYGTTNHGGANTLLQPCSNMRAGGILTTLVNFNGFNGSFSYSGLLLGKDQYLYGTTSGGGQYEDGAIFRMWPMVICLPCTASMGLMVPFPCRHSYKQATETIWDDGGGRTIRLWHGFQNFAEGNLLTLHHFDGVDGSYPRGALVQADDGRLYGTTEFGGQNNIPACTSGSYTGCGTIFRITTSGAFASLQFQHHGWLGASRIVVSRYRWEFLRHYDRL